MLHQNATDVSVLELVMSPLTSVAMIVVATLSQRVGRRTVLFWMAATSSVGASLAFAFMVALARNGSPFVAVAVLAIVASLFVNERFGKGVRSSGYGTAYTVSPILPSLYSVWIGLLQNVMPYEYAPVVLIALGGVLFAIGARLGPETVTGSALDADTADAYVPRHTAGELPEGA